mgnify:FL=1
MTMNYDPRETFERYKAIIIGLMFALIAVVMCGSLTSCHTLKTTEVVVDSTDVRNYQEKIDSLTQVISQSVSKTEYQHKLDSLISLRIRSEITAEKEGTIINYNNDGSIVSREEYHINLNGKKDTDKDVKVNSDTSYKQEIQTLMDRINMLSKTINQKDSTIYRLSEKTRSECKIAHFEGVLVYTYLIFFGWFAFSIIAGVRYVWKKFR